MSQGRIILIRHGRTKWNKWRYLGWEDIPLNDCGRQQAEDVKIALKDEQIDVIYASPLIRAIDTIQPLAQERNLPIKKSHHLKELYYGKFQGMLKSEQKVNVKRDYRENPVPGGESLFALYSRAERFLQALRDDLSAGSSIVVVGHFLINQMLYMVLHNIPFENGFNQIPYKPKNGSLFEIQYMIRTGCEIGICREGDFKLEKA